MTRYQIEYNGEWQAVVEIDYAVAYNHIREMVEFWSGWEDRLRFNDGNYIQTLLQHLGHELAILSIDMLLPAVLEHFKGLEGWVPLDGSHGIKIVSFYEWEFRRDEFSVNEWSDSYDQWIPIERSPSRHP